MDESKFSVMELGDMPEADCMEKKSYRFLVDLDYFQMYQTNHSCENGCVDFPLWYMAGMLDLLVAVICIWGLAMWHWREPWFAHRAIDKYWGRRLSWYGAFVDALLLGPKALANCCSEPEPVKLGPR